MCCKKYALNSYPILNKSSFLPYCSNPLFDNNQENATINKIVTLLYSSYK